VPAQALADFCREASQKAMVVIDEAYIDFLDHPETMSMVPLLKDCPNLVILRTFSKIHAMAGLRVGYALGNPSLMEALDKNYFNYSQLSVSNLSLAAARVSLEDAAHRESCKLTNAEARDYMIRALSDLHLQAIPSHTNFIFFPLGNYPGDFARDMLARRVILRSGHYADGQWARVSVGTLDEMKSCMRIMQSIWKA
ncbi:MAG TPA: aminotransferase class I/II-fold pyridoxal phosphate-dependent enzyme, partial [Sediminibacterium sp.]|nr:aminotransferase class I/II-fold pyridoxal phosphate-dependent enzyme [Sediminibacterium sp.]